MVYNDYFVIAKIGFPCFLVELSLPDVVYKGQEKTGELLERYLAGHHWTQVL